MKNKRIKGLSSALIALSALFFVTSLSFAEEQPVTIGALTGTVEVMLKDSKTWQPAEVGEQLREGDQIKTGSDGKAQLNFADGSFLKLKENSTLEIRTSQKDPASQATEQYLDFRIGEIMAELEKLKPGSTFQVETPTAVAAARGTIFYMRTGSKQVKGKLQLFTDLYLDSDDIIEFWNIISKLLFDLHQFDGSSAYADGTLIEPGMLSPAEQDAWRAGWDFSGFGGRGMRDVETEAGAGADLSGDVNDTTDDQNDAQDDANQDQTGEQDIAGLAKVGAIVDSDGDGVPDNLDLFPNDPNRASGNDADGDGIDDEFDPNDNDGPLGDLDGDGVPNGVDLFPNDPNRASGNDADGDGIDDEFDDDDDNDDLTDVEETDTHATDPNNPDSDGDTLEDGSEVNTEVSGDFGRVTDGAYAVDGSYSGGYTDPLDPDSDDDGISDAREQHPFDRSNPLDEDTDGDTVKDVEDAFPYLITDPPNQNNPNFYGSKDSIREEINDKVDFGTYDSETGVSGGIYDRIGQWRDSSYTAAQQVEIRNDLLADIEFMLRDNEIRRQDAAMEKIADAQMAKVLIDAHGYRVRSEQYILRPNANTVELLNVTLRTAEAGDNLSGLHTLDWKTEFNASLDSLSGRGIRDLPWNVYLDSYGTSIASTASVYPTDMSIELRHNSDYLSEVTEFGPQVDSNQEILSKQLNYDLSFPSLFNRRWSDSISIRNQEQLGDVIIPGARVDESSPWGFYYNVASDRRISIYPYVIGNNMAGQQSGYSSLEFDTLGDMLASADIGLSNNLEIELRTQRWFILWWSSSPLIDIVYTPMSGMDWNEDLDWNE